MDKQSQKRGVNRCKCDANISIKFMKGAKLMETNLHYKINIFDNYKEERKMFSFFVF